MSLSESIIEQTSIKPSAYLDYRLYLKALYESVKKEMASYSYQKFALDLGFQATTVIHQIVHGYRPLTQKAAAKIAKAIALESHESRYLLALVAFCNAKTSGARENAFEIIKDLKRDSLPHAIDQDLLDYFSEWHHSVIWNLVDTEGFKPDPAWIGKKIVPHIKAATVAESLKLLERLDLLRYDQSSGTYRQTQKRVTTGHRIKGMALVSYHSSMIDHAKRSLTTLSGERRDVSGITLGVSEETAQKLRAMIHAFQLQLLDVAEQAGTGSEVYQINIQMFPFTEKS